MHSPFHKNTSKKRAHSRRWLAVCTLSLALGACASATSIEVAEIGSFYVPSEQRRLADLQGPNSSASWGEIETGQVYVNFVRLQRAKGKIPVLFIPGGSLSGATYETTPDGRPGWQENFLRAGFSTYVADVGQVGRTPWPKFPELADPPKFRSKAFLWEVFRIGPPNSYSSDGSSREAYPGSRFPLAAFDSFSRQVFPRFYSSGDEERKRYATLFSQACPCIVIAHSAAAPFAVGAAIDRPDRVKALILIEPSGALPLEDNAATSLRGIPSLFMWGDHLNADASWTQLYATAKDDFDELQRAGVVGSWIDLPTAGVVGNSHMLMMDDNSREIAERIIDWLAAQHLAGNTSK